ncbi:MAG: methionyl-tRNA formyltransferase [Bacteroidota bacterium]
MKMNVVFIGGLTNGKIVYDYLSKNRFVDLKLAITYPDDCNKPRHIKFSDDKKIIKTYSANEKIELITELNPDLIVVAGWSELLSNELINIPKKGTIGFHPSKLPKDKGRSVLAWQMEEGYTETALTMFYYCDIPDGGDIIGQEKIFISKDDYINDVLNKVDEATYNLMHAYFPLLRQNKITAQKQDNTNSNFRRLRKEKDDIINWNKTSLEVYNKIRAISNPYPGAVFFDEENNKCKVWKAEIIENFNYGQSAPQGTIVAKLYNNSLIFKTKDSYILIVEWEKLEKK